MVEVQLLDAADGRQPEDHDVVGEPDVVAAEQAVPELEHEPDRRWHGCEPVAAQVQVTQSAQMPEALREPRQFVVSQCQPPGLSSRNISYKIGSFI